MCATLSSPLQHAGRIGLEANGGRLIRQVVLVDVDAEGDVLVLEVGEDLLTSLLKHAQLLECLVDVLLQLLLDAFDHLLFLLNTMQQCLIDLILAMCVNIAS